MTALTINIDTVNGLQFGTDGMVAHNSPQANTQSRLPAHPPADTGADTLPALSGDQLSVFAKLVADEVIRQQSGQRDEPEPPPVLATGTKRRQPTAVAGPADDPAKPGVKLSDWLADRMAPYFSDAKKRLYEISVIHLENRVRWCDDCGRVVVIPWAKQPPRKKLELLNPVKCACGCRTICPATAPQLDGVILKAWNEQLRLDGFAADAARKYAKYVRTVLRSMRDAGEEVPATGRLSLPASPKRIRLIPVDHLRKVLSVVDSADWPVLPNAEPGDWWRLFLAGCVLYGFRDSEFCELRWSGERDDDLGLTEGIYFDAESPHPEHREAGLVNAHGWLVYLPPKQEDVKPDPLCLPMSRSFSRLARIAQGWGFDRVCPISPNPETGFRGNSTRFYTNLRKLKFAAELADDGGKVPGWTPHDGRRTLETLWVRQFKTPETAQALTGHADRSVSGQFYCDLTATLIEQVDQFELASLFDPEGHP